MHILNIASILMCEIVKDVSLLKTVDFLLLFAATGENEAML